MSEDDKTHQPIRNQAAGAASSGVPIAPGTVLKGTYRIEAELGSGGMGTVYRAIHIGLDKTMAVKVLSPKAVASPESLARFEREAKVAGKVNHPAMTQVIDFGVEQGTPYIVMEYVDGVELAELIERQGPMPPRQAVAVMRQIVSLLHAAHTLGIVHRDLKPSNIKIVQAGLDGQLFVKVLDFGIAKVMGDLAGQLTSEGMMVGTPAYMAPEQISGQPIDGKTDIYAAGLIFHEMLSGKRAYQGETVARILHAQMSEPPPPITVPVPEMVLNALQKFYEKRPEDRFHTAAAADRALMHCEEVLRSLPPDRPVAPAAVRPGVKQAAAATPGGFSATMRRPESGAAQGPAATPEPLSATMKRPESGAAQGPAVAPGTFSATMQRPESGAAQAAAATPEALSGTMKRPASGAIESGPPPSPPARQPVTDHRPAPALKTDRQPVPERPTTDRQPAPAPPAMQGPPTPLPAVPAPVPARPPVPAAAQAKGKAKSSGMMWGCLIAVVVVGLLSCFAGVVGLGVYSEKLKLDERNAVPPSEDPYAHLLKGQVDPDDVVDVMQEEMDVDPNGMPPGCYLTELTFESSGAESPSYADWEVGSVKSRKRVDCNAVRTQEPTPDEQEMFSHWPIPEKVLRVDSLSPPRKKRGEPGTRERSMRVYTYIEEGH
jgi:serine/threonine protein kinase